MKSVFVYDAAASDSLSKVRGVGRYLQVLKDALPDAVFSSQISTASKFDVLINPFLNLTARPAIIRKVAKTQIAVLHDVIPLLYPQHFPLGVRGKVNLLLNKASLRAYDLIITDSKKSRQDIVKHLGVKEERVQVLYPAISPHFFEAPQGISKTLQTPQEFTLYVGDATWNKNLVTLAQSILIAEIPAVFVGKVFENRKGRLTHPWQEELQRFFTIAKDNSLFVFPGYVTDSDLVALYKQANSNILVSKDEGFGYSYFEAAAQGTPSVLSDVPVFRETAGDTALFANPQDPEEIADMLLTLSKDSKLRNSLGKKAHENTKKATLTNFTRDLTKLLSS